MEEQAGQLTEAVAVFKLSHAIKPVLAASTAKPAVRAVATSKPAPAGGKHVATPLRHPASKSSGTAGNDSQWQDF